MPNTSRHCALLAIALAVAEPPATSAAQTAESGTDTRVAVPSHGWDLKGDLRLPNASGVAFPVVLMLNGAARTRNDYVELAAQLARRGIASLRLDLRGHGESTNLGRFVPGESARPPVIWDSDADVVSALAFLRAHARVDRTRIGVLGASYSGEEMADAGRKSGYAQAYVALSPGSFSDTSINALDTSGVPWLFVASRDEPHLQEITAAVRQTSRTVEMHIVPGTNHASRLLGEHHGLSERIAVWLTHRLQGAPR